MKLKEEKKHIREQMKKERIGWMERAEFIEAAVGQFEQRFAEMDEKTVQELDGRNIRIKYSDIRKAKYSCATEDCDGEMNGECPGKLVLETDKALVTIIHGLEKNSPQEQELRRIFKQINI